MESEKGAKEWRCLICLLNRLDIQNFSMVNSFYMYIFIKFGERR